MRGTKDSSQYGLRYSDNHEKKANIYMSKDANGSVDAMGRYGRMAREHWRKYLPRYYKLLESTNRLETELRLAEQKTIDAMETALYQITSRHTALNDQDIGFLVMLLEMDILQIYILLPAEKYA